MKYLLAISGGIDSVVLLHKAATDIEFRKLHFSGAFWPKDFVVAHFDHGIRGDSNEDLEFVRSLAKHYDVEFVSGRAELGPKTSEDQARNKRYDFLQQTARKLRSAQIATAHHQDDLLETVAINLIRGTGWRGLAPMSRDISRPLLDITKADIATYAIDNGLEWRDDPTNFSNKYLRNRIRDSLVKSSPKNRSKMVALNSVQNKLRSEIERAVDSLLRDVAKTNSSNDGIIISRYYLVMIPQNVAIEILNRASAGELTRPQLAQALLFAKVAKPHKKLKFKNLEIISRKDTIAIARLTGQSYDKIVE